MIEEDTWLSFILKRPAFSLKLTPDYLDKLEFPNSSALEKLKEILNLEDCFVYSKVKTQDLNYSFFLEDIGFRIVDTNITFEKLISYNVNYESENSIRFANSLDEDKVSEIAKNSFTNSRFHLDKKIDFDIASQIKMNWAQNFFKGERGNQMIISTFKDIITGFTLLIEKEDTVIIDLIAVDENYYRRRIGYDMINFIINKYSHFSKINVTTQISNIPSMRLYEKSGFYSKDTCYVFHYHFIK